jgi:two-component system, NtrC family, sensor histidine kinase HydH
MVLLEVRDNGPGLSAEQLARVGQPFYTTKPRGLGVGLAMARRIVERAGGRLEIDSAPGRGTAVRLHLAAV